MKKKHTSTLVALTKSALALSTALTLAFHPGFILSSYASMGTYDEKVNYPYWDDPEYSSSSYWSEDIARKVTNVTRTYDDGTSYTATYKYNTQGSMTDANIKEAGGNRITIKRTFNENTIASTTMQTYEASDKSTTTVTTEYGNDETPSHEIYSVVYSDNTTESEETWYDAWPLPSKEIETDRDGTVIQANYTYNEFWQNVSSTFTSSDGSHGTEESQYGENEDRIYYKQYHYDSSLKTSRTEEVWWNLDSRSDAPYRIVTISSETEGETKVETWRRDEDYNISKVVTTDPDGTQTVEEYSYDMGGQQILYTKKRNGQIIASEKTEKQANRTTYTRLTEDGTHTIYSTFHDMINDTEGTETTITRADGSSSYEKQVYSYSTLYSVSISREKNSSGVETYSEAATDINGYGTHKEKFEDGSITTTKYDPNGTLLSKSSTFPDKTTTETTWEFGTDGRMSKEITKYSDGGEDRTDYEYDSLGNTIKRTTTWKNGVVETSEYEYEADNLSEKQSTTFNNGYFSTSTIKGGDATFYETSTVYSHGETAEVLMTQTGNSIHVKIIARDGQITENTTDIRTYIDTMNEPGHPQKIDDDFLKMARSVLP